MRVYQFRHSGEWCPLHLVISVRGEKLQTARLL